MGVVMVKKICWPSLTVSTAFALMIKMHLTDLPTSDHHCRAPDEQLALTKSNEFYYSIVLVINGHR
jgi:hypothetical protein